MLSILTTLFSFIPGFTKLAQSWVTASYDAKVKITSAKIGGNVERAKQLVEAATSEDHERSARLATIAGSTLLTFLLIAFAAPFVVFTWKVVVVDIVIGKGCLFFGHLCWDGNTDPIRGQVADWATTIIASIFGSATAMGVGKMILARKVDD